MFKLFKLFEKRKYQCFNCAEVVGSNNEKAMLDGSYPCPKCKGVLWYKRPTYLENIKKLINTKLETFWDIVTNITSRVVAWFLIAKKNTEQGRFVLYSRTISFFGITAAIYLVNSWFACGVDKAAIFVLTLYILMKWK